MGRRGPGTSGAASSGFGAVIHGEGGAPKPGTSLKLGGGGKGLNYATTKNGPKGDAAQQAHTNAVNQTAFQANSNVWEHKEKLAAQLEFNERDRANETAHHAERLGNELSFHAGKQLKVASGNDMIDIREMHRHLSQGSPYAAQAHADRYNASMASSAMSGAQLKPHVQTSGFTPVKAKEDPVSEREASDEINEEPKAQEERPEVKPEASNVLEATENVTEGVDKPADETPAAEEAKAAAPDVSEPVATPESGAENPDTKAPEPGEQKSGAISDAVNDGNTKDDIPAQPRVMAEKGEGNPNISDTQPIPAQQAMQVSAQQQQLDDKKANRKVKRQQAFDNGVGGVKAVGRAARRVDQMSKQQVQDEGGSPIEASAQAQKPEWLKSDDEGGTPITPAGPSESEDMPTGNGRSRRHFLTDTATVAASTLRGAGRGFGEGRLAAAASAAAGPEAPPVVETGFTARGAAQGFAEGTAKVAAKRAARSLVNKEQ